MLMLLHKLMVLNLPTEGGGGSKIGKILLTFMDGTIGVYDTIHVDFQDNIFSLYSTDMLITNAYVDAIRELIKSNKTEEIETRHRRRSKYLFMLYTGRELELSHNKKSRWGQFQFRAL